MTLKPGAQIVIEELIAKAKELNDENKRLRKVIWEMTRDITAEEAGEETDGKARTDDDDAHWEKLHDEQPERFGNNRNSKIRNPYSRGEVEKSE